MKSLAATEGVGVKVEKCDNECVIAEDKVKYLENVQTATKHVVYDDCYFVCVSNPLKYLSMHLSMANT